MKYCFFDTHVHLDNPVLCRHIPAEIDRAKGAGVCQFLVPGVALGGWTELLGVVRRVEGAWAAPGLHPLDARSWNVETADKLKVLLDDPKVVAVGEIGMDGLIADPPSQVQEEAFRGQLRLAVEACLPVLIHSRKATARVLGILREEGAQRVGGIWHAFPGSIETARELIKLRFAMGFGGALTYPGARRGPEVLKQLPDEWIVLETDAPDMAPHPYRGEMNRPSCLPVIARTVAEMRGWDEGETARITTANARRVLGLN